MNWRLPLQYRPTITTSCREPPVSAPLTEAAIQQMRDMIASGRLSPGSRLPAESELAADWVRHGTPSAKPCGRS